MKFGVGLFSMQTHSESNTDHNEIYRNSIEQVRIAEESGFDSAWLSEHHFLDDGYCPSPLVTAAAFAAVTRNIRIGTAAIILPLHDPVRVAEDAAVVDNISNGRFDLGIAIGYRQEEFDGFNIPIKQRPSRIEEGIDILNASWLDGSFSYRGKRYNYENISVTPKPVQRPIPIYIGAFEEPGIRRAGRMGYPLLIGPGRTMDMIRDTLGWYNDSCRDAGHDPEKIDHVLLREVFTDNNTKKAVDGGTRYIINMYRFYFRLGIKIFIRGRQVNSPDDPLFKFLPEDRFIIGTPEHCTDEIRKYREETGIEHIACRMIFPQASHDEITENIKLFGDKVIANFK